MDTRDNADYRLLRDIEIAARADLANALEDVENALGWVVITTEQEINRVRVYGLFDQPAAALECAAAVERFRREDVADEDDWSVNVYPLLPP